MKVNNVLDVYRIQPNCLITLMLLVASLTKTKWRKKPKEMTESLTQRYSSESTQQKLFNEYQHDRA